MLGNDEVATRGLRKSVAGENMECPHLAQSVRLGTDDDVEGTGCTTKDLPSFVCAGRDSIQSAARETEGEKERLLFILNRLERKARGRSVLRKETNG